MSETAKRRKPTWRETLAAFKEKPVITMLFLGYSAGVPLMLVLATIGFWLREMGVSRTAIGFFSLVGLAYAVKVFWAPLVDRLPLPGLTRIFGQRRSWMLLAQTGIIGGLVGMALIDPQATVDAAGNATSTAARLAGLTAFKAGVAPVIGGLMDVGLTPPPANIIVAMSLFALLAAFSSATQDIAIDAFRIESAEDELQGVMAAAYQYGYRIAILAAGAGALYIAAYVNWSMAYLILGGSMGLGVVTVLVVKEPKHRIDPETARREAALTRQISEAGHVRGRTLRLAAWFANAVISPFADFFARNGWMALIVLALIASFRLSDFTLGVMANPFYVDLGFSKTEVANIAKVFGVIMTMLGVGLGAVFVVRFGIMRMLLFSAFLSTVTNLLFAVMAEVGPEIWMLMITISGDNLAAGISGSVFIAYLSSLTNRAYTATQYALFTSIMSLLGKLVAGFSGVVVDATDWVTFFIYASALGIPSILLITAIMIRGKEGTPGYAPGHAAQPPAS